MISVRLSEEEYCALRRLCSITGARSVSDLTRDAMRVFLNSSSSQGLLLDRSGEFRAQMDLLQKKIEELAERVSRSGSDAEKLNHSRPKV